MAQQAPPPPRERRLPRFEPLQALRGRSDANRLAKDFPNLVPDTAEPADPNLYEAYTEYITTVSVAGHAASFEACRLLEHLCHALRPSRLLDTGSGFSSFVLRRYAASAGASVVSVDDSPEWLQRTRSFLSRHGVDTSDLVSWEEFGRRDWEPFELIFHDLAGGRLREEAMPVVTQSLSDGGVIVYDDAHHRGHRAAIHRCARSLKMYSARRWTLDGFGRWAILAVSPDGRNAAASGVHPGQ